MFCGDAAIYTLLVWILAETQIQCKNPKAPLVCKPVRHAELTRVWNAPSASPLSVLIVRLTSNSDSNRISQPTQVTPDGAVLNQAFDPHTSPQRDQHSLVFRV